MRSYFCNSCQQNAYLSDDEVEVFKYHKLYSNNKLEKCPYCIEKSLRAPIRRNSPRSAGTGLGFHELGGFYTNGGTSEVWVHPRKRASKS